MDALKVPEALEDVPMREATGRQEAVVRYMNFSHGGRNPKAKDATSKTPILQESAGLPQCSCFV